MHFRTVLLCHDNGCVLVVEVPVKSIAMATNSVADSNVGSSVGSSACRSTTVDSKFEEVTIKSQTRIYPGSLVQYCFVSKRLAVCGGSNVVKVTVVYYLFVTC